MMTLPKKLYRGPFVFESNAFKRALFPGGYVQGGKAHFYVCDLQGSVRQVLDGSTGAVEQETHYYPYGTPFGESTAERLSSVNGASVQPYLYGGKERLALEGFNAYDYGARLQFSDLGIFGSPDMLAGDFPAFSQYAYCIEDPINLIDPTGMKPTEEEGAVMAHYVYQDGKKVDLIGDWRESDIKDFNLNLENGLKCMLFEREQPDGNKEYVLAFAGTDGLINIDAVHDILQPYGLSEQYTDAMDLAVSFVKDHKKQEITFVGHSLGGGLAAASAYATVGQAMTYNPASVSPLTKLPNFNAQIDVYITINDPLNLVQSKTLLLKPNGRIHYRLPRSPFPWDGHGISNFHGPTLMEKVGNGYNMAKEGLNIIKNFIKDLFE